MKIYRVCRKILFLVIGAAMLIPATVLPQSQAGGVFLLIPPGARAGGMGETHIAMANDVYATYFNPAGLGFQEHHEITGMHMQWLPGLADDIYYEFVGYKGRLGPLGTMGASFTYLSLGEQIQTGTDSPQELGRFRSYMWNAALSYGRPISSNASVGVTLKMFRMFLAPQGSAEFLESQDGATTSMAVDVAFLTQRFLSNRINLGVVLSNLGPDIEFLDPSLADPAPTTLKIGVLYQPIRSEMHTLSVGYDAGKLIAARDSDGQPEPFFSALFDWSGQDGGSAFNQMTHNMGAEYWYRNTLALRVGGIYQDAGSLHLENGAPIPTFGAGVRIMNYGFDFGYIAADTNHPMHNTMRFSLNVQF